MFSRVCTLVALAILPTVAVAQKKKGAKYEEMDYGPFLSASLLAPAPAKNVANKGVAIHLGSEAAYSFDTDLLRWQAGWTGDFLALKGPPFDGAHGPFPTVKGKQVFGTSAKPGWAKPGTDDFKDPRVEPYGPLPKEWAKFKGLYRSGDTVVLSYTVGTADVLEYGSFASVDGLPVFYRNLAISETKLPMTLVVADVEKGTGEVKDGIASLANVKVALVGAPEGAKLEVANGQILLKLPALAKPASFRTAIAAPGNGEEGKFAQSLNAVTWPQPASFIKGGPPLWKETVTTQGVLGKDSGAYTVDTLTVPEVNPYHSWMRLGGFDFFSDGRAAVCTWSGDVWIVSGIDGKLEKLTWKRYAAGLFQPLGLKIVDDKVYTLGREGIVRLHDLNDDGEADFYEAFNNEVHTTTGFHEFAFDLQTDPEGNFYFAKGGPVRGGGRGFEYIANHSGCILKVDKYGEKMEMYASGLRAPNGIGVGPNGEVTSGDNEGTWTPACRLSLARPNGFLGCKDTFHGETKPDMYDAPICFLPKNVDNSNGGQAWVTSDKWGPFKGDLLHTSYGTCSLYKVLLEKDGDTLQGGVVKIPVSFASGTMRPRFSPFDGQLYIAGLKGWQTSAARDGALQRVRYTGKPANLPTAMKVVKDGITITFTDPLDPASIDAENFAAKQWNYLWCSEYGSANYSAKDPDFFKKLVEYNKLREDAGKNKAAITELAKEFKQGTDTVNIDKATLLADGKTVHLKIADLHPVMQMNINYQIKAADGSALKAEIYNTINRVPQ